MSTHELRLVINYTGNSPLRFYWSDQFSSLVKGRSCWQQGDNGGRSLISPLFSKDVYSLFARFARKPHPTPTFFTLASLAFSFPWANREAVNGL